MGAVRWADYMLPILIRVLLVVLGVRILLQDRMETASPLMGLGAIRESWAQLRWVAPENHGSHSPLSPLLAPLSLIADQPFLSAVPNLVADAASAWLLSRVAGSIAGQAYLWSPFALLVCLSGSAAPLYNLLIITSTWAAATRRPLLAGAVLACGIQLSIHAALLAAPLMLLLLCGPEAGAAELLQQDVSMQQAQHGDGASPAAQGGSGPPREAAGEAQAAGRLRHRGSAGLGTPARAEAWAAAAAAALSPESEGGSKDGRGSVEEGAAAGGSMDGFSPRANENERPGSREGGGFCSSPLTSVSSLGRQLASGGGASEGGRDSGGPVGGAWGGGRRSGQLRNPWLCGAAFLLSLAATFAAMLQAEDVVAAQVAGSAAKQAQQAPGDARQQALSWLRQGAEQAGSGTLGGQWFVRRLRFVAQVEDVRPNLGLAWYLFAQAFPKFRGFFLYCFHAMPAALAVPLVLRFPGRPLLCLLCQALSNCLLGPYPTYGDIALWLGLLPVAAPQLARLRGKGWWALSLLATLALNTATYQLWWVRGVANANFFYGMTLAWGGWQVLFLIQLLKATARLELAQAEQAQQAAGQAQAQVQLDQAQAHGAQAGQALAQLELSPAGQKRAARQTRAAANAARKNQ